MEPLRLWSEPHVGGLAKLAAAPGPSPRFFIVGVPKQEAAIVVTAAGVAVVVLEAGGALGSTFAGLDPPVALTRNPGGKPAFCDGSGAPLTTSGAAAALRPLLRGDCPPVTPAVAELLVAAIHGYYTRQIAEPSVRGFLKILEMQFTRADLFLFELLQNAVDDAASRVAVRVDGRTLRVMHNGRQFNPVDVWGLASVGLSSKVGVGRTVGFMGIGFKAVYKRFKCVTCSDDVWGFQFNEPPGRAAHPGAPTNGWVMTPRFVGRVEDVERRRPPGWVAFTLERPRGSMSSVADDLRRLPPSVPALLGRTSLHKTTPPGDAFHLAWDRVGFRVSIARATPIDGGLMEEITVDARRGIGEEWAAGGGGAGGGPPTESTHWIFLTTTVTMSAAAIAAFCAHTKRPLPAATTAVRESISLFFALDGGSPADTPGLVHAVLPTTARLPFNAHVQANWLLSVDRTNLQSVDDNAWNAKLLAAVPGLHRLAAAWVASSKPRSLRRAYSLLPLAATRDAGGRLLLSLAHMGDAKVDVTGFDTTLRDTPVVPAFGGGAVDAPGCHRVAAHHLEFATARRCIMLPYGLLTRLSPGLVQQWFGRLPFAATATSAAVADSPLWDAVPALRLEDITKGGRGLAAAVVATGPAAHAVLIRLWAGLGAVLDGASIPPKPDQPRRRWPPTRAAAKAVQWPVFPVGAPARLAAVTAKHVSIVHADVYELPEELRAAVLQHGGGAAPGRESLLDGAYGALLAAAAGGDADAVAAKKFVEGVVEDGGGLVSVQAAVRQLFLAADKRLASQRPTELWPTTESCVASVVGITRYAATRGDANFIPMVLREAAGGGQRLIDATRAYLGADYGGVEVGPLLAAAAAGAGGPGPGWHVISPVYLSGATSRRTKFRDLFLAAGCLNGPRFVASRSAASDRVRALCSVKLRTSSKTVALPYGLGGVSRSKYVVIDASLAPEWLALVRRLAGATDPVAGLAVLRMLLVVDVDAGVDAAKVPAFKASVSGRVHVEDKQRPPRAESVPLPSTVAVPSRRRVVYLPQGAPGVGATDVGAADWIATLQTAAWVPTARGHKKPAETCLPAAVAGSLQPEHLTPIAAPDDVATTLLRSPLFEALGFATALPPPPYARFRAFAADSPSDFDAGVRAWRAVCAAFEAGKLTPEEVSSIRRAAASALIPVSTAVWVKATALVSPPVTQAPSSLTRTLVDVAALYDVTSPSFPLSTVSPALTSLLRLPTAATPSTAEAVLASLMDGDLQPPSRPAFSACLYTLLWDRLNALRESQTRNKAALKCTLSTLLSMGRRTARSVGLRLWCGRGPGQLAPCWRAPPAVAIASDVVPVHDDDGSVAAHLQDGDGYQFLGVLNSRRPHGAPPVDIPQAADGVVRVPSPSTSPPTHVIDQLLRAALGVASLSSPGFALEAVVSPPSTPDDVAGRRVSLVVDLVAQATSCAPPALPSAGFSHARALSAVLRTPKTPAGGSPVTCYAMCRVGARGLEVSVSGEAFDWPAALGEEVLWMLRRMFPWEVGLLDSAPARKALALLAHVRDGQAFKTLLLRHFGGHEIVVDALGSVCPAPPPPAMPVAGAGRGAVMTLPAWMEGGGRVEGGLGGGERREPKEGKGEAMAMKVMKGLGWDEGTGLGAEGSGIVEPVEANGQVSRQGLGYDKAAAKKKRKAEAAAEAAAVDGPTNVNLVPVGGGGGAAPTVEKPPSPPARPAVGPVVGPPVVGGGRGVALTKPAWMEGGGVPGVAAAGSAPVGEGSAVAGLAQRGATAEASPAPEAPPEAAAAPKKRPRVGAEEPPPRWAVLYVGSDSGGVGAALRGKAPAGGVVVVGVARAVGEATAFCAAKRLPACVTHTADDAVAATAFVAGFLRGLGEADGGRLPTFEVLLDGHGGVSQGLKGLK